MADLQQDFAEEGNLDCQNHGSAQTSRHLPSLPNGAPTPESVRVRYLGACLRFRTCMTAIMEWWPWFIAGLARKRPRYWPRRVGPPLRCCDGGLEVLRLSHGALRRYRHGSCLRTSLTPLNHSRVAAGCPKDSPDLSHSSDRRCRS
jgi:hypothetical protein